jgi:hypothetical protein
MRWPVKTIGIVAALAQFIVGCGALGGEEDCTPCSRPVERLAGFPSVVRESSGRVVSTLRVGEVVHVCAVTSDRGCGCSPGFTLDWESSDPAVAAIASGGTLDLCNDVLESSGTLHGATRVAVLAGQRPGETQISAILTLHGNTERITPIHCLTRSDCVPLDVLRVVAP